MNWELQNREQEEVEEVVGTEINWEVLEPKKKVEKVRKPLEIKCWFGNESDTGSSSASEEEGWKSIDRKKRK